MEKNVLSDLTIYQENYYMGRNLFSKIAILAVTTLVFSCAKKSDDTPVASGKSLYFATGQCNSGNGITTFSTTLSSRMVAKANLSTKATSVVFDLASEFQLGYLAPETGAQSIVDNGSSLLLLTENGTNMGDRKIFSIPKNSPFNTVIHASDSNALTQVSTDITRSMVTNPDGTLLFSKTRSIEKIGTNSLRVPAAGPSPYVNAPGGTCATSATFMSAIAVMPPYTGTTSGKIIFAHQGTPAAANRIGIINKDGYNGTAADCYAGTAVGAIVLANDTTLTGPISMDATNNANPTSLVYIPDSVTPTQGKLLVSYSAATAGSTDMTNGTEFNHGIVMYDVNESSATAATITGPGVILYRDSAIVFGISAMAYDSSTNSLYVATASQPGVANQLTQSYGYKIEKFSLDLTATTVPKLTLVRENNKPFIDRSSFTKCITSMAIGD